MKELQTYIEGFGFGISVKELVSKAYRHLRSLGHDTCIVNDRYIEVDGRTYYLSKSRKHNRWIAKEF